MRILFFIIIFNLIYLELGAQAYFWVVQDMANMPEPVSNNAVVEGWANDTAYVYSFGGIDSTKIWSGIHLKSWRYNTVTDVWDSIPSLPDTLGKIAMAASYVDSIIYIIGGYHVYANSNEASSAKVHRYDPRTNSYLSDGADIPVPIDDHVQAVWNDSLIYVITGWSNTGNVPNVQIYDPANDAWYVGDPVPNSSLYMAFGASGTIIGNTIYYHGGARNGINFPGQSNLRVGHINPTNPTQISWNYHSFSNPEITYRSIAVHNNWSQKITWIGGANTTYNYNGIAYNGTGGVNPRNEGIDLDTIGGTTNNFLVVHTIHGSNFDLPMDLRGYGSFNKGDIVYIAGGMLENQLVSDRLYYLTMGGFGVEEKTTSEFLLFPNPILSSFSLSFDQADLKVIRIYNLLGNELLVKSTNNKIETIDISNFATGIYTVSVQSNKGTFTKKIIKH